MNLEKRDRAFLIACFYLGLLFLSTICLWYVALIGGLPFTVTNVGSVNKEGELQRAFHAGEVAGIKRVLCSERAMGATITPSLRSAAGLRFYLPSGIAYINQGCGNIAYGFTVPHIPPGQYQFDSIVRFQNNLVGRDEHFKLPPVVIEVTQ